MIPRVSGKKVHIPSSLLMALGLAAMLSAGSPGVSAQQNPPEGTQATSPGPDSQGQTPSNPTAQQQDVPPQNQADQQGQQGQAQPNQPVLPATLTVAAGTVIRVRVDEWLSSDRNVIGDNFSAVLEQPVVVQGWVVARRGQAQTGRVSQVKKGKGGGSSELGLDLPELTLVDGQQLAMETQLFQASTGPDRGRQVATVGSTAAIGAVIGAIAGGGTGAAIGAGVGASAGVAGVMTTRGAPTEIRPETVLSFKLQSAVTISTANSQFAFQPVTQSDYDSRTGVRRPRMRPTPPPPPAYYPYPYAYYPYPYPWYPEPFIGFGYYGGFHR